jgi:ribosomal protein S18 acetylase RimI-like enzyme
MTLNSAHPLDNPIWHALTTSQSKFAETCGTARRFPVEVTSLAGFNGPASEGYDSLAALMGAGEVVALFLESPPTLPAGWTIDEASPLLQMVHEETGAVSSAVEFVELGTADVPQMMALAELTKPGPFGRRTRELGTYLGIRRAGSLICMVGERLHIPGYTEVSAVCTHPDHFGRGYASSLINTLIGRIRGRGEVPFLHVRPENTRAVELYARLGFTKRALLCLAVLRRSEP